MKALSKEYVRLGELRGLVDDALQALLPDPGDPPHRLHAAMRYALLSPGKRIRPVLALLCAQHLGAPLATALPGACALEFVHAASLVLDDLPCMDDAPMRRGQPSVHVRYGEDIAVLTGVALLNEAYAIVSRAHGVPEATRVQMTSLIASTVGTSGLVGGQESDLRGDAEATLGYLSQVHHQKTGVLFVASVEMGGLAAGADVPTLAHLRRFAVELGLAFQALDDLDDADEIAAGARPVASLLTVMGPDGVLTEARNRLTAAKKALRDCGARMTPMCDYVDLLVGGVESRA